jgi:hypothetical protein
MLTANVRTGYAFSEVKKMTKQSKSGIMLIVIASLALSFATIGANAKEAAEQAHGTVVQSQSKDNIVLARSAEQTLITAEIKMYSQDRAAPRWILSSSEIETLKMKLTNLPRSSRVDVPDWDYVSVTNFNNSRELPYSSIYAFNNRLVLVDSAGKRSYYIDTKKAGEWLMLLAESRVPSAFSQRPVRSGSGVAMVINAPETKDTRALADSETDEVKNQNMMEYAPYMVVVLVLILFAFFAFRRPKTEGA